MINILKKMLKTGVSTRENPFREPPRRARGKILVTEELCTGCSTCVDICPVSAIDLTKDHLTFDYGKCMYCGLCVDHCPTDALEQSNQIKESAKNKDELKETFIIDQLMKN